MELTTKGRAPATIGDVLDFLYRTDACVPTEKMATAILPGFLAGAKSPAEWEQRREELVAKASRKLMAMATARLVIQKSRMVNGEPTTVWSTATPWPQAPVIHSEGIRSIAVRDLRDGEDERLKFVEEKAEAFKKWAENYGVQS